MAQVGEPVQQSVDNALVKTSLDGSIGTITLDNPAKHNALSAPLIGDLLAALVGPDKFRSARHRTAGTQGR